MVQAKTPIAAPTSRRNFIKSGAALIAALTVMANAVPSVEAEIARLVSEFESHGYMVAAVMDRGKSCGLLLRFPEGPRVWGDKGYLSACERWNKYSHASKPELVEYLIKTGRVDIVA